MASILILLLGVGCRSKSNHVISYVIRPNSFIFYDYTQGDGYIRTFREISDYALKITDVIITDSLTPYPKSLTLQNDPEAEALLNAVGDVHYERVGHHMMKTDSEGYCMLLSRFR